MKTAISGIRSLPMGLLAPAAFLALVSIVAAFAPLFAPYDPLVQGPEPYSGFTSRHLLGTDQFGRDVLSRLIYGARADLVVALGATAVALVVGSTFGLVGGLLNGWLGGLFMRSTEVILSFPPIVLALLVVALFGPGAGTLILSMGILFLPAFARIAYGQVLSLRNREFVVASRGLGARTPWVLVRVILPNISGPIIVQMSLTLATAMLVESGLSYLGLGVVPPTPSWGSMIAEAQNLGLDNPGFLFVSCSAVVATVFAFSMLGDALDRQFDPRRRHSATTRTRTSA